MKKFYLWIYFSNWNAKYFYITTNYWIISVHHHHHHVAPPARISLTLSRHFSLSFIASGRSSGLHPVSSHSCCMYVRAGRPTLAHPYVGVHRSTSLMCSSLLLQQCPACLVRRTCIVFVMGGNYNPVEDKQHTKGYKTGLFTAWRTVPTKDTYMKTNNSNNSVSRIPHFPPLTFTHPITCRFWT